MAPLMVRLRTEPRPNHQQSLRPPSVGGNMPKNYFPPQFFRKSARPFPPDFARSSLFSRRAKD